jgi:hypothetical protein
MLLGQESICQQHIFVQHQKPLIFITVFERAKCAALVSPTKMVQTYFYLPFGEKSFD